MINAMTSPSPPLFSLQLEGERRGCHPQAPPSSTRSQWMGWASARRPLIAGGGVRVDEKSNYALPALVPRPGACAAASVRMNGEWRVCVLQSDGRVEVLQEGKPQSVGGKGTKSRQKGTRVSRPHASIKSRRSIEFIRTWNTEEEHSGTSFTPKYLFDINIAVAVLKAGTTGRGVRRRRPGQLARG